MRTQLIKIKQDGAKSREITPNQPKWIEVHQGCENPIDLNWSKLLN